MSGETDGEIDVLSGVVASDGKDSSEAVIGVVGVASF